MELDKSWPTRNAFKLKHSEKWVGGTGAEAQGLRALIVLLEDWGSSLRT